MKRSAPLQRKSPLKSKKGLKRTGRLNVKAKQKRVMGKPDPRWRSKDYLKWVRSQPCVMCNRQADDAHHIKGIGHLSGAGIKAPDQFVMPLCREDHDKIHNSPELWPKQWEWIARTLAKAIDDEVLVMGPL